MTGRRESQPSTGERDPDRGSGARPAQSEPEPGETTPSGGQHSRADRFALARAERWLLRRMARRAPARVVPDHLTLIGVAGSIGVAVAYMLTNRDPAWLWAASAALVVQWLGDSMDGTLARAREIERPRYGFYLDHLVDAFSTCMVGIGLGLSPYMLLSVGLAIVIAYLLLSINVYLETHVYGEFDIAYGWMGPTEARIALIGLNTVALAWGAARFRVLGVQLTAFDVGGMAVALGMVGMLAVRVGRNLDRLARLEPPPGGAGS